MTSDGNGRQIISRYYLNPSDVDQTNTYTGSYTRGDIRYNGGPPFGAAGDAAVGGTSHGLTGDYTIGPHVEFTVCPDLLGDGGIATFTSEVISASLVAGGIPGWVRFSLGGAKNTPNGRPIAMLLQCVNRAGLGFLATQGTVRLFGIR